jgi:hypothetical protein
MPGGGAAGAQARGVNDGRIGSDLWLGGFLIPDIPKFFQINLVLAARRRRLVCNQIVEGDKRYGECPLAVRNAVLIANIKSDSIDTGQDLDFVRFSPDFDDHLLIEEIRLLQADPREAKVRKHPHLSGELRLKIRAHRGLCPAIAPDLAKYYR